MSMRRAPLDIYFMMLLEEFTQSELGKIHGIKFARTRRPLVKHLRIQAQVTIREILSNILIPF